MDYDYYGILNDIDPKSHCGDHKRIAMAVVIILIVIVGLFGNAIVFFVILVLKEYKKSVSNWYVLQLALADTIFLLMLPFIASENLAGKWGFTENLCKAKEGIIMVNYYASILFLTIMSFDRYIAVTRTGVSKWADTFRRLDSAAVTSLVAWCVSVCLAVPLYLYSHVDDCDDCAYNFPVSDHEKCMQAAVNETACAEYLKNENGHVSYDSFSEEDLTNLFKDIDNITNLGASPLEGLDVEATCKLPDKRSHRIWLYLNFAIMLVLPLVLICAFYGLILRAMMGTTATASSSQRRYRRRVTFMVLALVALFAISWVPWYALNLAKLRLLSVSSATCQGLTDFTEIMTYLNSALNPYFYSFMGSRFHQRFLRARTAATRKSRLIHYFSRVSWARHDSTVSNSGGGSCKINKNGKDSRAGRMRSQSDDGSYNTKTNVRTEPTMIDTIQTSP